MSAPVRVTSHSWDPHGCGLDSFTRYPISSDRTESSLVTCPDSPLRRPRWRAGWRSIGRHRRRWRPAVALDDQDDHDHGDDHSDEQDEAEEEPTGTRIAGGGCARTRRGGRT